MSCPNLDFALGRTGTSNGCKRAKQWVGCRHTNSLDGSGGRWHADVPVSNFQIIKRAPCFLFSITCFSALGHFLLKVHIESESFWVDFSLSLSLLISCHPSCQCGNIKSVCTPLKG